MYDIHCALQILYKIEFDVKPDFDIMCVYLATLY